MNCKDCNQQIEPHAFDCRICKKVAADRSRCIVCAWKSACHRCSKELPSGEDICESCYFEVKQPKLSETPVLISNI